jgi:hypothetical protein
LFWYNKEYYISHEKVILALYSSTETLRTVGTV